MEDYKVLNLMTAIREFNFKDIKNESLETVEELIKSIKKLIYQNEMIDFKEELEDFKIRLIKYSAVLKLSR